MELPFKAPSSKRGQLDVRTRARNEGGRGSETSQKTRVGKRRERGGTKQSREWKEQREGRGRERQACLSVEEMATDRHTEQDLGSIAHT